MTMHIAPPLPTVESLGLDPNIYRVEREIARGSLKVVTLVTDLRSELQLAVKTINPSALKSPRNSDGLSENEAKKILRAELLWFNTQKRDSNSENVPVYGQILNDSPMAIGYEYVPQSLTEVVGKGLPREKMAAYVEGIFGPIEAQIKQGIYDGDIDPQQFGVRNGKTVVLLDADGSVSLPTLNVNSVIYSLSVEGGQSAAQRVLAKALYMSPEQAANKPNEERTSVYLLGQMVHFLATGNLPAKGQAISLKHPYECLNETLRKAVGALEERQATVSLLKSDILSKLSTGSSPSSYASSVMQNSLGQGNNVLRAIGDPANFFRNNLASIPVSYTATAKFNPDGKLLAVSDNGKTKIFSTDDFREPVRELAGTCLQFSSDSSKAYFSNGRVLSTYTIHGGRDFKLDGEVNLSLKTFLTRWNEKGEIVQSFKDGKFALVIDGAKAEIWKVAGGERQRVFEVINGASAPHYLRGMCIQPVSTKGYTHDIYTYLNSNGSLVLKSNSQDIILASSPAVYNVNPHDHSMVATLSYGEPVSTLSIIGCGVRAGAENVAYRLGATIALNQMLTASYADVQFGRTAQELLIGGKEGILRLLVMSGTPAEGCTVQQVAAHNFGQASIKSFGLTSSHQVLWVQTRSSIELFGV